MRDCVSIFVLIILFFLNISFYNLGWAQEGHELKESLTNKLKDFFLLGKFNHDQVKTQNDSDKNDFNVFDLIEEHSGLKKEFSNEKNFPLLNNHFASSVIFSIQNFQRPILGFRQSYSLRLKNSEATQSHQIKMTSFLEWSLMGFLSEGQSKKIPFESEGNYKFLTQAFDYLYSHLTVGVSYCPNPNFFKRANSAKFYPHLKLGLNYLFEENNNIGISFEGKINLKRELIPFSPLQVALIIYY